MITSFVRVTVACDYPRCMKCYTVEAANRQSAILTIRKAGWSTNGGTYECRCPEHVGKVKKTAGRREAAA